MFTLYIKKETYLKEQISFYNVYENEEY